MRLTKEQLAEIRERHENYNYHEALTAIPKLLDHVDALEGKSSETYRHGWNDACAMLEAKLRQGLKETEK